MKIRHPEPIFEHIEIQTTILSSKIDSDDNISMYKINNLNLNSSSLYYNKYLKYKKMYLNLKYK